MARKLIDEPPLRQSNSVAVLGLLYTLRVVTIFYLCLQTVRFPIADHILGIIVCILWVLVNT